MARLRSRFNPSLVVGGLLVGLVVLAALVSFVWTPYDPTLTQAGDRLAGFSREHLLGGDRLGRDVFSQLLVGARTTLLVGIVAVGLAALIGVPLGLLAAMLSWRWVSELLMRTSDLLLAFPALLLATMLAAVYGGGVLTSMIAIGIATVPAFTRVVRSGALTVLTSDYVLAARAAGRGSFAIALKHVLPNVMNLILVQASVAFAIAILAEAALSFLGLGAPPDTPAWGRMLFEHQSELSDAPRMTVIPGLAIALAVLGFNLLGDGLRDLLDPRLARRTGAEPGGVR